MTDKNRQKGCSMRILMITAARTDSAGPLSLASVIERARALQAQGNEVAVLHLRAAPLLRRARSAPQLSTDAGIEVLGVQVPLLSGPLRGQLPGVLRRVLPRALRAQGFLRPDLVVAEAQLPAASAAQVLSVLSGIPHLIVAAEEHDTVPSGRRDREILGHALLEAVAVAATPDVGVQLRRHWVLPHLETLAAENREEWAAELAALSQRALATAVGPRMVFHAPYVLAPSPTTASRQRPNMMLEAFKANGHRVHLMTGDPVQRRRDFADLRRRRRAGQELSFVYSENSTQPNLLSTSAFHGISPVLEALLLAWCSRAGIPFGQFYRDVYWRYPEKQASVAPLRRLVMQAGYRFDLLALRAFDAHFFLPSKSMGPVIPAPESRCTELPPGAQIRDAEPGQVLHLLYVGGVGPGHEIDECLAALQRVEKVSLTMVVPPTAWETHRERYLPLLTERVHVVHANAGELAELYDGVSACLLLVEPNEYRKFAVPMKLYEYLGYGKPTLASEHTLAGEIVEGLEIGYTAAYERESIIELLERLLRDPAELERCTERVQEVRHEQSWAVRAGTVQETLTGGPGA